MTKATSDFNLQAATLENLLRTQSVDNVILALSASKGMLFKSFGQKEKAAVLMTQAALKTAAAAHHAENFINDFSTLNTERHKIDSDYYDTKHCYDYSRAHLWELEVADFALCEAYGIHTSDDFFATYETAKTPADVKSAQGTALAGQMLVNNLAYGLLVRVPGFPRWDNPWCVPVVGPEYGGVALSPCVEFTLHLGDKYSSERKAKILKPYTDGLRVAAIETFEKAQDVYRNAAEAAVNAEKKAMYVKMMDFCESKISALKNKVTSSDPISPQQMIAEIKEKQEEYVQKNSHGPGNYPDDKFYEDRLTKLNMDSITCGRVIALISAGSKAPSKELAPAPNP